MSAERLSDQPACEGIPDPHSAIPRAGDDVAIIWRDSDRIHLVRVEKRGSNCRMFVCVPDADCTVVASRNKGASPRGQSVDRVVVPFEMQLVVRVVLNILLRSYVSLLRSTYYIHDAYL